MNCPRCNKDELEFISGDFPTGVEMDGYRETRYERGFQCANCGLIVDEDDVEGE